ncbi:MAG: hypothetical protein NVS2B7_29620 [Herpetosiphon sp.]
MQTHGSFTVRTANPAVSSTRQRRWVAVKNSFTLLVLFTALLLLAVTVFAGSALQQASPPLGMVDTAAQMPQATSSATLAAISQAQVVEGARTAPVAIPADEQADYLLTLPPEIQTQFARQTSWESASNAANEAFIRGLPVEMQEQIRRFLAGTSN